ncbi:MAG: EAL domain-containing protein [Gammaproteobacteria bacterium]|jgi:diguanylate cyclase (GGDEF)-like protein
MTNTSLRLLIVDDSENDVLLLVRELQRQGYSPDYQRVCGQDTLTRALTDSKWDLIITDHYMPELNSGDVITAVKNLALDVPVIIVSGLIPEDAAVAAMKAGAQDYIMKDNLARLIPAIERELNEAKSRAARAKAETELDYISSYDPLTNLVNRTELERRLQHALNLSQTRNQSHVFLYIDIDQFKIINDTAGHVAGDELIRQLALILKKHIRETDTLARLGGDEFGVLLENCPETYATDVTRKILELIIEYRFYWQDKMYRIGASIGYVEVNRENVSSVNDILGAADVACYTAKDQGGNRIKIYRKYDYEMTKRYGEMQWVSIINHALEHNRFCLYAQSIFPAGADKIPSGHCEFLIRMMDEEGTVQKPDEFIPAAERYHLMPKIDRWVIENVFSYLSRQVRAANQRKTKGSARYFINISGMSLSDSSFYQFVKDKLEEYNIPPHVICFEVTETAAIEYLSNAVEFIGKIRADGCCFALDDFGSGVSSFTYLRTIPVDFIKIDGTFVTHMQEQPMDRAIVEAINHIGHIAGMQTIAEFVETEEALRQLYHIGVDFVQGYGLEAPHPLVVDLDHAITPC